MVKDESFSWNVCFCSFSVAGAVNALGLCSTKRKASVSFLIECHSNRWIMKQVACTLFMNRTEYDRVIIREINRTVLRMSDFPIRGSGAFSIVAFSPNLHVFLLCSFSEGEDGNFIILSIPTPSEKYVLLLFML